MEEYLWELAKLGYESYTADSGNKNFKGDECPAWDDLPQPIRDHWLAAVKAVVRRHDGQ